jgi:hypothetical protein
LNTTGLSPRWANSDAKNTVSAITAAQAASRQCLPRLFIIAQSAKVKGQAG